MAGIFDIGRPTGYAGGLSFSKQQDLDQREQAVRTDYNQAEFFDFMDAQKKRLAEYDLAEDRARAGQQVLPGATSRERAVDKYQQGVAEKSTRQLPQTEGLENLKVQDDMRKIMRGVDKDRREDFTQAYYTIRQGVQGGTNPEKLYNQVMGELQSSAKNKKAFNKTLSRWGMDKGYSPEALESLANLTNFSLHDPETSRAEYLATQKYLAAIAEAKAKSGGMPDPESKLGKMLFDQNSYIQQLQSAQPGSNDYFKSLGNVEAMQRQIDSYQGTEEAGATGSERELTADWLATIYPSYSSDLEGDAADTAAAKAFAYNTLSELTTTHGSRAAAERIFSKYYRYDPKVFDSNKFVLVPDIEAIGTESNIYSQLKKQGDIKREFESIKAMGADTREVYRQALMDVWLEENKDKLEELRTEDPGVYKKTIEDQRKKLSTK